jgi:hypothetical protein
MPIALRIKTALASRSSLATKHSPLATGSLRHRLYFSVFLLASLTTVHLSLATVSWGQTETATLSGVIQDPKGAVVPDAEVIVTRIETATATTTKTNGAGIYVFTGLQPGHYHLMVRKPSFKEIAIKEFELHVQDKLEQNFSLEIGSVSETITVNGDSNNINTTDGSVSTVVDRNFVANLPLNGRTFQNLVALSPGVVLTTPSATQPGQFSINGQRTDSNYITVDGVSANIGLGSSGQAAGGSLSGGQAALTSSGGFNSLVSIDALQEFRVQTSSFAPEYGRTPGGQIALSTRSGTSQFHGTAFDYFRNDALDAADWFVNADHLTKPRERQNDFGGVLGGPIRIPGIYDGKRTFFFFSVSAIRRPT